MKLQQCPQCHAVDAPDTVREDGQHGRTRCGACLVATPNREWSDFEIVLSEKEAHAQAAKQLSLVGMAALTADEVTGLARLAELVSGGDQGTLTHAFGCIVAGYALKKYDQNKATKKAVHGAISTVRQMRSAGAIPKN